MNNNYYEAQQHRAWSRKLELVKMMGGCCSRCGYDKNLSALEFHHVNPEEKTMQLDSRHLANSSMEKIIEESKKCVLLCSNCHKEEHYPEMDKVILENKTLNHKSLFSNKKQSVCPVCGKEFEFSRGKVFCSPECRKASKKYPDKEEVRQKYQELKSQQKVANYYHLTRRVIQRLLV